MVFFILHIFNVRRFAKCFMGFADIDGYLIYTHMYIIIYKQNYKLIYKQAVYIVIYVNSNINIFFFKKKSERVIIILEEENALLEDPELG
ncbi:hypothetical protein ACJX0J_018983, partial [Zea mays]